MTHKDKEEERADGGIPILLCVCRIMVVGDIWYHFGRDSDVLFRIALLLFPREKRARLASSNGYFAHVSSDVFFDVDAWCNILCCVLFLVSVLLFFFAAKAVADRSVCRAGIGFCQSDPHFVCR